MYLMGCVNSVSITPSEAAKEEFMPDYCMLIRVMRRKKELFHVDRCRV
jgi:hypothetical protein